MLIWLNTLVSRPRGPCWRQLLSTKVTDCVSAPDAISPWCWELNSGPCAPAAITFLNEPPPQPQLEFVCGSQFPRSQPKVSWPCCLWACGEAVCPDGGCVEEQAAHLRVSRKHRAGMGLQPHCPQGHTPGDLHPFEVLPAPNSYSAKAGSVTDFQR